MGIFDFLFETKESKLKKQIRISFNDSVSKVCMEANSKDPLFRDLMIRTAIANLYDAFKKESTLYVIASAQGLDFDEILDDECKRAMNKYL